MKYIIKFACNTAENECAREIVTNIYYQKKYISEAALPIYENSKTLIVSNPNNGELTGCATVRMPDGMFECEKLFKASPYLLSTIGITKSNTVELGRFAKKCLEKDQGNFTFFLLNWALIKYLKKNKYCGWLAILKPDLYKCLTSFGYKLRIIDKELNLKPVNIGTYKSYFNKSGKPHLVYSSVNDNDKVFSKFNKIAERFVLESEL